MLITASWRQCCTLTGDCPKPVDLCYFRVFHAIAECSSRSHERIAQEQATFVVRCQFSFEVHVYLQTSLMRPRNNRASFAAAVPKSAPVPAYRTERETDITALSQKPFTP